MEYHDLISGMKRFGACDDDVCINSLGIASNMIHDNVVITPGWEPQRLSGLGRDDETYRLFVRKEIISKIILNLINVCRFT